MLIVSIKGGRITGRPTSRVNIESGQPCTGSQSRTVTFERAIQETGQNFQGRQVSLDGKWNQNFPMKANERESSITCSNTHCRCALICPCIQSSSSWAVISSNYQHTHTHTTTNSLLVKDFSKSECHLFSSAY